MPTFETLPPFERDWKSLTAQQRATFSKVIKEAFVPDLIVPDRPFRPGLRVKGVTAHPGGFEMTWDGDGRATFRYGTERVPGQAHIIWRRSRQPPPLAEDVEPAALVISRRRRTSPVARRAGTHAVLHVTF